ncbi:hypothetical protein [Actinomadura sp. 21ATH]|uniref:hypothetical protein n=1 Tax=Actinomadura sp. 21ATH TaxID=1735444 RepID=UPI0035C20B2A
MLMPNGIRVVVEVDGQHHYGVLDTDHPRGRRYIASSPKYSEMVAEDRSLRLAGYEVYRFGGHELLADKPAASVMVAAFFGDLLSPERSTTNPAIIKATLSMRTTGTPGPSRLPAQLAMCTAVRSVSHRKRPLLYTAFPFGLGGAVLGEVDRDQEQARCVVPNPAAVLVLRVESVRPRP